MLRKYARSLEDVDVKTRGTSKSAVSRRFVALTQKQLDEMLKADLAKLELAVLMIDGIYMGDHVVLVALGVDIDGAKQVLGIHEGATENETACKGLLANLAGRGMRTDQSILVVIDGSPALRKALRATFGDKAVVQRCQIHKMRNVVDYVPDEMKENIKRTMRHAYKTKEVDRARTQLKNLARALENDYPSAANSINEGLEETLTVKGLRLPEALERTLSTTNAIENIQSGIRRVCKRVTTWKAAR